MAKLTAGIGFSSASGSVGSNTYARSRAGLTLRNHGFKSRKTSPSQMVATQRFAAATKQWRTLTETQRRAWNAQADALRGIPGYNNNLASGFAFYVSCWINCQIYGTTPPTTPPPMITFPILTLSSSDLDLAADPYTLPVTFTLTGTNTARRILSGSRIISAGVSNWSGESFRFLRRNFGGTAFNALTYWEPVWQPLDFYSPTGAIIFRAYQISSGGLASSHVDSRSRIYNSSL